MTQLTLLKNNKHDEALSFAFDIIGEDNFEIVSTINYIQAEKEIALFDSDVKWIVFESDKFFAKALNLLNKGVNCILITPYKPKEIKKNDVKLTLF